MHDFHPHAPEIKYIKDDDNTCVFSSMDSASFDVNENVAEHPVLSLMLSSSSCDKVG